jgi:hypothetical protein
LVLGIIRGVHLTVEHMFQIECIALHILQLDLSPR